MQWKRSATAIVNLFISRHRVRWQKRRSDPALVFCLFLSRHACFRRLAETLDAALVILVLFSPRRYFCLIAGPDGLVGSGCTVLISASLRDLVLEHDS